MSGMIGGEGWNEQGLSGAGTIGSSAPDGIAADDGGRVHLADHSNGRIVSGDDITGAGLVTFGERGNGTGRFQQP
jgi:hypothetical protein